MNTKAILIDKDGTLIDFDAFWIPVTRAALTHILADLQRSDLDPEELLAILGHKDGFTDITGIFSYGGYEQVGRAVHSYLEQHGCRCTPEQVVELLSRHFHANLSLAVTRPICPDTRSLLLRLRDMGFVLSLVTTDTAQAAEECLALLNIRDCFSAIYSDDGVHPIKPDPYAIHDLCQTYRLTPDQLVMVGDTVNDMRFARNGGIRAIGVAQAETNRATLARYADAVIPDLSHLLEVLD